MGALDESCLLKKKHCVASFCSQFRDLCSDKIIKEFSTNAFKLGCEQVINENFILGEIDIMTCHVRDSRSTQEEMTISYGRSSRGK